MPELELMGVVLIFSAILFFAYMASRFIGNKAGKMMKSKHMQVIEQISIGLDKRLLLIRVGHEHYLFIASNKEFRRVAKVSLDVEETTAQTQEAATTAPVFDFRQIFEKYISVSEGKKPIKKADTSHTETNATPQKDEIMQRNIHKLEQLREKSYDKEV